MSPKEAYKYSRALRTHLSQYNICTKQDVAPFPVQICTGRLPRLRRT